MTLLPNFCTCSVSLYIIPHIPQTINLKNRFFKNKTNKHTYRYIKTQTRISHTHKKEAFVQISIPKVRTSNLKYHMVDIVIQ